MDTTTSIYKPPFHEHPLFPSARFVKGECKGCHVKEIIYGGYFCNEYDCHVQFHKKCAKASLEINHLSHPQHPLMLSKDSEDGPCDFCGEKLLPPCYSCSTCEFKVDLTCGMKPSPSIIEHPMCHDHPLVFLKKQEEEVPCELCKDSIGGRSYSCLECDVSFHVDCVYLSKEVNHPRHYNHPLKLIASGELTNDEKNCLVCGNWQTNMLYHCSTCNFISCLRCTREPPPLFIEDTKTHKHPLTLFSRKISFICDVCGTKGCLNAYICIQCDFVVHGKCISLPRVININRHEHRVSFTHHLGPGYSKCGICRQSLSQYTGAYFCSVCPKYGVHLLCAIRTDVWDTVELEGIPEIIEDIVPFKVVGDNLIRHFSHDKHLLRFYNNYRVCNEWIRGAECIRIRCVACIHPLGFDSIYGCEECQFVLHEKCANLPMKKRLVFSTRQYTLTVAGTGVRGLTCNLCGMLSSGFQYISHGRRDVCVHCGSLSEPFVHDGHLHPLYFYEDPGHFCDACDDEVLGFMLRCDECDFDLCLCCATLPEKIRHSIDEHPLTLCCGEKASSKHWCDICERELDLSKWFYTCSDCGGTLHVQCVLEDFSRLMPGCIMILGGKKMAVVSNNHNTRPLCSQCHSRCKISIILKVCDEDNGYICSFSCFLSFMGLERSYLPEYLE